tara:strand:+ start:42 stop:449 length:408 start_codon:yes stop_codon:yes gene_type:complete
MGYTNYWQQSEKFTDEEFKQIEKHTEKVVRKSIMEYNNWIEFFTTYLGTNGSLQCIEINGDSDKNLDHEPFIFENKVSQFEFCKTNQKPYDWVVWLILSKAHEIAPSKISIKNDDGESYGTWLNSQEFVKKENSK